jgi:tetratricopeptide (TPR) repeat protein
MSADSLANRCSYKNGRKKSKKSMSTEAQDWITKATELRQEGRIEESIIAARKAISIEPESANAWWQLALSVSRKDGDGAALDHLLKTVELAPNFAFGWHRVGLAYSKAGLTDEAEEAWKTAVGEDSERTDSLQELLQLYRKRDAEGDKEQIFIILEQLDAQKALTSVDVHTLAIAYYNKGEYLNAIPLYKRCIAEQDDEYAYFNIGLAYSQPAISQDVDSVDAWRQSLRVNPEYDRPKTSIANVLPKLLALKQKVLASTQAAPLIPTDQWFINYLNPYELLNFNELESSFDLETKEIQRAKNGLIHEIQLEDGLVSWLPGLTIDRSRIIQVTDELFDEEKKEWHFAIYENKELLNFLSRGSVDLFLIDEEKTPFELLLLLEVDDGFTEWLSPIFATQYNQVFSRALETRNADLIEALMDGRRWVRPEHEDICFEAALRQCEKILEPLRRIDAEAEKVKTSLRSVKIALEMGSAGKILTLLPAAFQAILSEAASLVRGISVSTNNAHHDPDLAKEILNLAKDFAARAPSVRMKIEQDAKTLDEIIQREKKNESFLTFSGKNYNITREGAEFAEKKLLASEVETVRWGIVNTRTGNIATQEYTMVIGGPGAKTLSLSWTSMGKEEQRKLFFDFVGALDAYIVPKVVEKLTKDIKRGGTVFVGGAAASRSGIVLRNQGWFSTKEELCPWTRLQSEITNGEVIISDRSNPKSKLNLPLVNIDNAWVLHQIVKNGF